MRDPALQHAAERRERGLSAIEADRKIETLVALPVAVCIVLRQHVEVDGSGPCLVLLQQFTQTAESSAGRVKLDRALIRSHHGTVVEDADLLRPKQHLRAPRLDRVRALSENLAQEYLGQLMEEQGWNVDPVTREQARVSLLERRGACQTVTKAQPHTIVFARIGIDDFAQFRIGHGGARLREEAFMKDAFRGRGFGNRRELGAQEKALQEFVGDNQSALGIGLEQTVTAGGPEVRHKADTVDVGSPPHYTKYRRSRFHCAFGGCATPESSMSPCPLVR